MEERKRIQAQALRIEKLLISIQAKFQAWRDLVDQDFDAKLDIRIEFSDLENQGERGQIIAQDWSWALAFGPE